MEKTDVLDATEKMKTLLDLFEFGESVMRENLKRKFSRESEEQIDRRFLAWRLRLPGYDEAEAPAAILELAAAR
jgi:hypothetical protein